MSANPRSRDVPPAPGDPAPEGRAAAAGTTGDVATDASAAGGRATRGGSATATDTEPRDPAAQRYELDWSALMKAAQDGDADAYRELLAAIAPYLRALASRRHRDAADIEDAVQDIMLTIHAIRHTYDPARPFGPWLVAIANRRLVDRLRRQGRQRARETTLEPHHETFPAPETNLLVESQERRILHAAVAELPTRQREAITLLKLQELSLKEASAASGMSIASLKVSVHRGMKNLRKILPNRSDGN